MREFFAFILLVYIVGGGLMLMDLYKRDALIIKALEQQLEINKQLRLEFIKGQAEEWYGKQ